MDKKIFLELSHKRERTTEREFLPDKVRERERERERERRKLISNSNPFNPLENNSFGGYCCLKLLIFNISGGNIWAFLGSVDSG